MSPPKTVSQTPTSPSSTWPWTLTTRSTTHHLTRPPPPPAARWRGGAPPPPTVGSSSKRETSRPISTLTIGDPANLEEAIALAPSTKRQTHTPRAAHSITICAVHSRRAGAGCRRARRTHHVLVRHDWKRNDRAGSLANLYVEMSGTEHGRLRMCPECSPRSSRCGENSSARSGARQKHAARQLHRPRRDPDRGRGWTSQSHQDRRRAE